MDGFMLLGLFSIIANAIGDAIKTVVGFIVEPVLSKITEFAFNSFILPLLRALITGAKPLAGVLVDLALELSDAIFEALGWKRALIEALASSAEAFFKALASGPIIDMMKWTPINYFDNGSSDITIGDANPYFMSIHLMKDGVMPTAMTIFALIVMIELFQITVRTEGMRNSGFETPFKLMLKVAIVKILLDNTQMVLEAIFNMATDLFNRLQNTVTAGDNIDFHTGIVDALMKDETVKWYGILLTFIPMSIQFVFIKIIMLIIPFILFGRVMEMYIYIVLAPLPFSTFASQELSQIGKTFIKQFLAISLRIVIMYVIILIFSSMIMSLLFGNVGDLSEVFKNLVFSAMGSFGNPIAFASIGKLIIDFGIKPIIFSIMLLMSLMDSEKYAKAVVGAMY